MIKRLKIFVLLLMVFGTAGHALFAGGSTEKAAAGTEDSGMAPGGAEDEIPVDVEKGFEHQVQIDYATGFSVEYHDYYKVIDVLKPYPDALEGFRYVLLKRGAPVPDGYPDATVIEIPVRSFISMSSTYLHCLDMLGVLNTLVAVDNGKYVYNPKVRERVRNYQVLEVASQYKANIETILEINPGCIMTTAMGNEWDIHPKLLEANLPVVINGDWNEKDPLGRAEWLKFIAAFYNREKEAEELFSVIERQYTAIKAAAGSVTERPTLFSGAPFNDVWHMPGGESFQARFFNDAGGDYIWEDTVATGSLHLAFETVFYKAENADFWMNAGWEHNSLEELLKSDERFANFKAFKEGRVYSNNRRLNEDGGNDYWESGIVNPHVVLADLVKILHPEIIPDHELFYYKRLK